MKAETSITWIDNSVRPYESLWSIVNRFVYLNHLSPQEFAAEYFLDYRFHSFSPMYSLNEHRFNQEKFRLDLGINMSIMKKATLDILNNTFVNHTFEYLKYCPKCLEAAYHSAFFQLIWVKICPIHGVKLEDKCPNCNALIGLTFDHLSIRHPFVCHRCGWSLIPNLNCILNPSGMLEANKLKSIFSWCLRIEQLSKKIAVVEMLRFDKPYIKSSWVFPILQETSNYITPKCISERMNVLDSYTITSAYFKCPINLAINKVPEKSKNIQYYQHTELFTAVYKSYRRHLIKKELGSKKYLLAKCARFSRLDSLQVYPTEIEKVKKVLAILSFRQYLEGWGDGFARYFGRSYLRGGRSAYNLNLSPSYSFSKKVYELCVTTDEVEWVNYHIYYEELSSLYKEAVTAIDKMIEEQVYYQYPWMVKGNLFPCSFISRESSNNDLHFISIHNESDRVKFQF